MQGATDPHTRTNMLPAGVSVGKAHWLWRLPVACRALSSAAIGGGLGTRTHVISRSVEKNWPCLDPIGDTASWMTERGVPTETAIGLMTSVFPHALRGATIERDGWHVDVLATAGVGNAAHPADPPVTPPLAGTINIIALIHGALADGALIGAVQTITEAKSAALAAAGIRTAAGDIATGTTTDTVTVLVTGTGPRSDYAGLATPVGAALATATLASVRASLAATAR